MDVELELQFDAEPLLSAVGLKHLEDTAFSSKVWFTCNAWIHCSFSRAFTTFQTASSVQAMTLTSYSLKPMADVLKSKYYITLPLAALRSTQHRFHWHIQSDSETLEPRAVQPHDFSANPTLNVVPLALDTDAQKTLPEVRTRYFFAYHHAVT